MNIGIFAASGTALDAVYFDAARELGRLIAQRGHTLIFGGGRDGLMGACADAALEQGGRVVGVMPGTVGRLWQAHEKGGAMIYTDNISQRKMLMVNNSDALIVLPGGLGTMDELFETLARRQLGQHRIPVALISTLGFYDALDRLLKQFADGGFMGAECLDMYRVFAAPAEALDHVEKEYAAAPSGRTV